MEPSAWLLAFIGLRRLLIRSIWVLTGFAARSFVTLSRRRWGGLTGESIACFGVEWDIF